MIEHWTEVERLAYTILTNAIKIKALEETRSDQAGFAEPTYHLANLELVSETDKAVARLAELRRIKQ